MRRRSTASLIAGLMAVTAAAATASADDAPAGGATRAPTSFVLPWLPGRWTKCLQVIGCDCDDGFELEAIGPSRVRIHSPDAGHYSDWDLSVDADVIEYRLVFSTVAGGPERYRERILNHSALRPLEAGGSSGTVTYAADEYWGRCP